SVPVPSVVAPSLNVTVPVGTPTAGATAVTVAVKVTDSPDRDGFTDEVSAVVVSPFCTTWSTVFDVLPLKLLSASYSAVIGWEAVLSAAVLNVATPEAFS